MMGSQRKVAQGLTACRACVVASSLDEQEPHRARRPPRVAASMPPRGNVIPVELNQTIVHAHDSQASGAFLADLMGRDAPIKFGPFYGVEVDNRVTLDCIQADEQFIIGHYAFLLSEEEFDQIFGRIQAQQLPCWAGPAHQQPGSINHHDGGRGVYWNDLDGRYLEIITRPYGGIFECRHQRSSEACERATRTQPWTNGIPTK
jgi:hypothetical protein